MPLGGGLTGTLPNPGLIPNDASMLIARQAFAPRFSLFGSGAWWMPPVLSGDTRNQALISDGPGPTFWKCIANALTNTANQATFNSTATNITGCSFPIGIGEKWAAIFAVPLRATAGITGVGFNLTVPASTTGALTIRGGTSAATAETTIYTTAITTNTAKSFCTVATTDLLVMVYATLKGATAAGTVQLQGQSGAVGTTIQVNEGAFTIVQQSF